METTNIKNLWEFLEEEPPTYAKETKALFEWSLNYDHHQRPFNLFLDLIRWSWDNYGVAMSDDVYLGYIEADYLADALKEWANNPHEVSAWIDALMSCED